jgi:hypothetical protein
MKSIRAAGLGGVCAVAAVVMGSVALTAPLQPAGIPSTVPLGTVVAWMKSHTNTPALPPEWVECNGQTLNAVSSPYHGSVIPNLNGASGQPQRFLRGAVHSGGAGGSEAHNHGRFLTSREGRRTVNVSAFAHVPHLPPHYDVVWIMKVR